MFGKSISCSEVSSNIAVVTWSAIEASYGMSIGWWRVRRCPALHIAAMRFYFRHRNKGPSAISPSNYQACSEGLRYLSRMALLLAKSALIVAHSPWAYWWTSSRRAVVIYAEGRWRLLYGLNYDHWRNLNIIEGVLSGSNSLMTHWLSSTWCGDHLALVIN